MVFCVSHQVYSRLAAVVVIAVAEPVHAGDVDGVAPHVFQRAVVAAVAADLGVAMELAADDLQVLAADAAAIARERARSRLVPCVVASLG